MDMTTVGITRTKPFAYMVRLVGTSPAFHKSGFLISFQPIPVVRMSFDVPTTHASVKILCATASRIAQMMNYTAVCFDQLICYCL